MALGSSPHLPVSVCGTGSSKIPHSFSRHRLYSLHLIRLAYARGNQRPVELRLCVTVLNFEPATEFLPYVHRLRLSA